MESSTNTTDYTTEELEHQHGAALPSRDLLASVILFGTPWPG